MTAIGKDAGETAVTLEMIEAALAKTQERGFDMVSDADYFGGVYLAMKAFDPEIERVREALEPFARAVEAIEVHDPQYPPHGSALRASFDFWARHPGLNNDELIMRESVRFKDLCRLRDIYALLSHTEPQASDSAQ